MQGLRRTWVPRACLVALVLGGAANGCDDDESWATASATYVSDDGATTEYWEPVAEVDGEDSLTITLYPESRSLDEVYTPIAVMIDLGARVDEAIALSDLGGQICVCKRGDCVLPYDADENEGWTCEALTDGDGYFYGLDGGDASGTITIHSAFGGAFEGTLEFGPVSDSGSGSGSSGCGMGWMNGFGS